MKSYAAVEYVEKKYFRAEVELIPFEKSMAIDFEEKETEFMNCENSLITEPICEGDILIVEHNNGWIQKIYRKDEEEKQRRILVLKDILG